MSNRTAVFFRRLAVLMFLPLLFSCQYEESPKEETDAVEPADIVTINAVTLGNMPASGLNSLYQKLDPMTVEDFGCVVRLEYIPWGDERNQLNIAIASGQYDLIPQGNFSDYLVQASKNAFLDIAPYLDSVPDLREHYRKGGKDILEMSKRDGKLYGIPQYGIYSVNISEGFLYREDLRREWDLPAITDLGSMEDYIYRAKEDPRYREKPLITDNRVWTSLWYMLSKDKYFEVIGVEETPYCITAIDEPYTVISRVETTEFKTVLEYIHKWHNEGIFEGELLASQGNEGERGLEWILRDEKPCETNNPIWSINSYWMPKLYEKQPKWEWGFFSYLKDGKVSAYKSGSVNTTVISVSSKTRYPEIAVGLLEKLHVDPAYYHLLAYGVEGENYILGDENRIYVDSIPAVDLFPNLTGISDEYTNRYTKVSADPLWMENVFSPFSADSEKISAAAEFHPLDAFVFSKGSFISTAAELTKAWRQYMHPLLCGITIDSLEKDYQNAIEKLKEAGLDTFNAELQSQLDSFKDAKAIDFP